ncbi:transcription factor PAR1-like [Mangifera indica]|uniref:transcription factor PAR1-like n=1 Tax=Mangifera indica TaxID=29780 RepID=UPI001CFBB44D|nr:transcription factor PAR1-like [Mangifera indica]
MENALSSTASMPKFRKSERKIKTKTHMKGEAAVHERDCSCRCSKRGETASSGSCERRKRRDTEVFDRKEDDGEDEIGEVERKIVVLQRIVPGGESLGVDKLFEETAGYILALQCQIKAMKALVSFVQGLEKEKRKFGG